MRQGGALKFKFYYKIEQIGSVIVIGRGLFLSLLDVNNNLIPKFYVRHDGVFILWSQKVRQGS